MTSEEGTLCIRSDRTRRRRLTTDTAWGT